MSHKIAKLGYCRSCRKNLHHVSRFRTGLGRWWGLICGERLTAFRLGNWSCPLCANRCWILPLPREDAPELQLHDAHDSTSSSVERLGNDFRSHRSLVARSERARRFSPKFRESVVDRLLSGTSSFAQLRSELGVSESDLLAWIAELIDRKNAQIEKLSRLAEIDWIDSDVVDPQS